MQGVWYGENEMKVFYREQPFFQLVHPFLLLYELTFGTVLIAT
jgi:hypothetical protein